MYSVVHARFWLTRLLLDALFTMQQLHVMALAAGIC
jgi:hypothetical protein